MVTEQETLIYIEDQDKLDASAAANAFAHKETKNRAYINTLGAELALKYLASENIDVSNIYNIHSIKKILEEIDISDIMLPNIHIDVRVVFDENVIFIPKSHFEFNLTPDIYLVFNLAKDFSHVKFLGFFEPKLINKNNANNEYYFIEKEKLSSPLDLKKYIEAFKGNTKTSLSPEDMENSERIIISMADNDISDADKKYLIKQLTKSAELRDKFIEYENFETLSYKAMTSPDIKKRETPAETNELSLIDGLANLDDIQVQNEPEVDKLPEASAQPADTIPDLTEELNLEPINDITFDEPVQDQNNHQSSDIDLLETGSTLAEAAAAGISGAALAETTGLAGTAEAALNTLDTALDIVDTGLDIGKDLISDETTAPEAISFDDIDTSQIDNIQLSDEQFKEETISLNTIDLPETPENTDFIEQIDNKISFDDIQTGNVLDEPAPFNMDEETISLDDIDTSAVVQEPVNENFEAETLSFDDIDTSNISNQVDIDESLIDNTISFDEVNIDENEIPLNSDTTLEEETLSFDNIEEPVVNEEINDFMDTSLSLDDTSFETLDELPEIAEPTEDNKENIAEVLNEEPSENNELNSLEQVSENIEEPEIIEDETEPEKHETFGKNLVENLSEENLADISIENLDIDESVGQNAEDISSSDLLSQIDDILNASSAKEVIQEENSVQEQDTSSTENISDISDISDINEILSEDNIISEDNIASLDEVLSPEQELPSSTQENNTFDGNVNDMPETGIDELLNFDDFSTSNSEENTNNNNEEDNIGVLFNDTDPVSDAELDTLEEEHTEPDMPEQPVPGAALFNQKPQPNKKAIIVAAALVTVIAAASAFTIFKPKNDNAADIEPLNPVSNGAETTNTPASAPSAESTENILATNAPDISKNAAKEVQKKQPEKELKSAPAKPKQTSSESYLSVNRLVWDVPGTLSYSTKMQNYLRTAGKSIKLSLSADLLLATEYAYTNQVKVNLKLSKDGNIKDAVIASSSGSTQIDNIVLQSVKDTLNVVKPPSNEIKTPDFNLSLIIYF